MSPHLSYPTCGSGWKHSGDFPFIHSLWYSFKRSDIFSRNYMHNGAGWEVALNLFLIHRAHKSLQYRTTPHSSDQFFLFGCSFDYCQMDSLVCRAHICSARSTWCEKHTASSYARCNVNRDYIAVLHIEMCLFSLTVLWFWAGLVLQGFWRKATKGDAIAHVVVQQSCYASLCNCSSVHSKNDIKSMWFQFVFFFVFFLRKKVLHVSKCPS